MANSTPRGLPGFLRRSMRSDMMDDDEYNAHDFDSNINHNNDNIIRMEPLSPPQSKSQLAAAGSSVGSKSTAPFATPNAKSDPSLDAMSSQGGDDLDIPTRDIFSTSNISSQSHNAAPALTSLLQSSSSTSKEVRQEEEDNEEDGTTTTTTTATSTDEQGKRNNVNSDGSIDEVTSSSDLVDQIDYKFRLLRSPATCTDGAEQLNPHNTDDFDFDQKDNNSNKNTILTSTANPNDHSKKTSSPSSRLFSKISSTFSSTLSSSPLPSNRKTLDDNNNITSSAESKTMSNDTDNHNVSSDTDLNIDALYSAPPNNVINNTNKSNTSKSKKSTMNYKETEFEKVITEPVVDIATLRKLGWNGIPAQHRPQAWKILLGYLPTNKTRRTQTLKRKRLEYLDIIKQHYDISDNSRTNSEQETLRQVLVDVPRTAPEVPLFRNDLVRQSLSRLLYIWACRHPASGYVQGINDLATPLIAVFLSEFYDNQNQFFTDDSGNNGDNKLHDSIHGGSVLDGSVMDDLSKEDLQNVEADVYWCLTNLLAGIQDHYTSDQPGVQRMVMRLEDLVNRMDGELTEHLRNVGVEFIQFAFRWMNCLLLREFKLECVIRLWDTYLSEGDGAGFAMGFETFHVYVCAAFLCQFSGLLRTMEFDELFGFMQNVPTSDWGDGEVEILLSQAFVLSTLFHGSDAHLSGQSTSKRDSLY